MRINHNITALNTYNKLSSNQAATSKSLEKLSSGLKINKAGDNAAGLAISEKMRGQIRGLDQASTNASDAISLINTAEGALSETHSILQRMRELAVQSSNDTNVTIDRDEIQKEMNQLTSEINRIGNTTEFNTQKLLDGGGSTKVDMKVNASAEGGKKGAVSTVSTLTPSQTGKSKADITLANGMTLSIEADAVGEELNGINFVFAQGGADITRSGNTVTITNDFDAITVQDLEDQINASGYINKDVNVTMTSAAGVTQLGTTPFVAATHAVAGRSGTATGGLEAEVRGSFSFDITESFKNAAETIAFNIPTGGSPSEITAVTLTSRATGAVANEFNIGATAELLTKEEQATNIRDALQANATVNAIYDVSVSGSKIVLSEKVGQTQGMAVETGTVTSANKAGVYTYGHTSSKVVEAGGKFEIDGEVIQVVDGSGEEDALLVSQGKAIMFNESKVAGSTTFAKQAELLATAIDSLNSKLAAKYQATDDGSGQITLTQRATMESDVAPTIKTSNKAGDGFEASFQIGANTAQSLTIEVDDMRSAALKVSGTTAGDTVKSKDGKAVAAYVSAKDVTDGTTNTGSEYALDVSTHEKATAAISVINDAIQTVSAERSKLGSYQNRLEHTINNLGTSSENLTSAESRIRDVDMAKEMMEFTKNNILSQAAQSMLAQANQQPQGVLQLLQ